MPIQIHIDKRELYDERTNTFIQVPSLDLIMEHSLISVSKWEAKWKKSFLSNVGSLNTDEMLDYFSKMCIKPQDVDPNSFLVLPKDEINKIVNYIKDEQSATVITYHTPTGKSKKVITSEQIYYWMVAAQIPFECEKWHLSRLLKLIEIYGIENDPKGKKKMKRNDIYKQNDALNAARRAKHKTKG